jgi:hypothetical protein
MRYDLNLHIVSFSSMGWRRQLYHQPGRTQYAIFNVFNDSPSPECGFYNCECSELDMECEEFQEFGYVWGQLYG